MIECIHMCTACAQAPHDQPMVAQAMIERWVEGVLKADAAP